MSEQEIMTMVGALILAVTGVWCVRHVAKQRDRLQERLTKQQFLYASTVRQHQIDVETIERLRHQVSAWMNKQGQDQCWYYPEIFTEVCTALDLTAPLHVLPPRAQFEEGCARFQWELYLSPVHLLPCDPLADGAGHALTLCCGVAPRELPNTDRLTADPKLRTCDKRTVHQAPVPDAKAPGRKRTLPCCGALYDESKWYLMSRDPRSVTCKGKES